ncbi:MAG: hypothetical protein CSYNP_01985 [Syntrophus sp. SKADARSKE-3]|nr:hypothetical protein [Syntrophus sp. SKADARSKE-3]
MHGQDVVFARATLPTVTSSLTAATRPASIVFILCFLLLLSLIFLNIPIG